jgi:acyl carrier protein
MSLISPPDVTQIKAGLKSLIVDRLNLPIDPASIQDDAPLFGTPDESVPGGLALDSVEALEIVVGIEEKWGVVIQDDSVSSQFYSIDTLSALVVGLLTEPGEKAAVA